MCKIDLRFSGYVQKQMQPQDIESRIKNYKGLQSMKNRGSGF